jgi:hypothetical protein
VASLFLSRCCQLRHLPREVALQSRPTDQQPASKSEDTGQFAAACQVIGEAATNAEKRCCFLNTERGPRFLIAHTNGLH